MASGWKLSVQVARNAAWAPIAVLVAHAVLSSQFGHEPYVDPFMHLAGGMSIAFLARYACSAGREYLGKPNALAIDLIAFGLAVSVCLLWELGEFMLGGWFGSSRESLGNSMQDLFLGTLGSGSFVLGARLFRLPSSDVTSPGAGG